MPRILVTKQLAGTGQAKSTAGVEASPRSNPPNFQTGLHHQRFLFNSPSPATPSAAQQARICK